MSNTELQSLWTTPSPHWGTGIDSRSSQSGLFSLFYATLARASHYQWLNAGRTLVDKTYLTILCKAQRCSMLGIQPTELASRLDSFIRTDLVERWSELDELDHEARHQLALALHSKANTTLFMGEPNGESTTSQILFFLVPQLPFFPMNADRTDYGQWHAECRGNFTRALPHLTGAVLPGVYGDEKALGYVAHALKTGDWWQRWQFSVSG